jgi:hypothetical protein
MWMMLYAEPSIRAIGSSWAPKVEKATDDKGHDLAPQDHGFASRIRGSSPDAMDWQFTASLACPPDLGSKLTTFKGSVRLVLLRRSDVVEFTDLMKARQVTKTAGGRRLTLMEFRKGLDAPYEADFVLPRDGLDGGEFLNSMSSLSLKLVDVNGKHFSGQIQTQGGGQQYDLRCRFRADTRPDAAPLGEPAKIVWEVATETEEVTIPFEFKDVPLP